MAQIDVTDTLSDPDFVDGIELVTRIPAVNSAGESIIREQSQASIGCVQPVSGATLMRLADDLRKENVRSFWYKGQIVATAPGKYSSILVFNGERYQVRQVFDWSNWGQGWTEGVCVAEQPS